MRREKEIKMEENFLIIIGTIPWILLLMFVFYVMNSKVPDSQKIKSIYLVVLIFMSLRYGIGYDYYSYRAAVEGKAPEYITERYELLPRTLAFFSRGIHYQVFFIITSLLSLTPIFIVCKRMSIAPAMSFVVFLLYPQFFFESLGAIRNAVAYSFVFLMFYYLYNKKYLKMILSYLVALGFHSSAIMAIFIIPLFFLLKRRSVHVTLYLISFILSQFLVSIVTVIFDNSILMYRFSYYVNAEDAFKGGGMISIIINLIGIFNLIYWNRLYGYNKLNEKLLPIINVGVCMWNAFLAISPVFAIRFSLFYLYFLILLAPTYSLALRRINPLVNKRIIYMFCSSLFLFSFALQFYNYYELGIHMSNIPYQLFFLHSDQFSTSGFID